jgi:hypothetical protein
MSEFTKGPWRIGKQFMSPSQKQKVIPIEWESVQCEKCGKSDGYRLIGWVFTQSLPIEQQKANAKLIVCAPEMAEMLLYCVNYGHYGLSEKTRDIAETLLKKAGVLE